MAVQLILVIDEIQKAEPFVFIKDTIEETPAATTKIDETPIVAEVTETKSELKFFSLEETTETEEKNNIVSETPVSTIETTKTTFVINDVTDNADIEAPVSNPEATSREEQIRLAQERIKKLKELTLKMKTPEGLSQLEKESAWSRKQINLENNSTPSKESNVSRYTLGENNEIRPNNSFLHDNVD